VNRIDLNKTIINEDRVHDKLIARNEKNKTMPNSVNTCIQYIVIICYSVVLEMEVRTFR